jgi:ribosomal protein S18 acetylase RimI-like enzyme
VNVTISSTNLTYLQKISCDEIALQSKFTRGFAKPSRFYLGKPQAAFDEGNVLVALSEDGEVVGFAWVAPMKPLRMHWSTLYDLGVHTEHQRAGIGGKLLEACKQVAKCGEVRLVCDTRNTKAKEFYLRRGFTLMESTDKIWRMVWNGRT